MKRVTSMLVILAFMCFSLAAQDLQITGTVTSSEDGSVLPGVSVVVKGTTTGVATNIDGKYSLSAPADAVLVFTSVGMITKEVEVASRSVIDVEMEAELLEVGEVVITAFGISREKKSLGYAVQEVDGEELDRARNTNVINSITGKVAGVQVKNSTNFGGSSNILIRGASSIEGNNQALFIVDGVPVSNLNTNNVYQESGRSGYDYGNPVQDISSSDIASISVLKGAAATALYGSRAANGVILIETKKGKKNSLVVNVNHSTMFHTIDPSTFPKHQEKYGTGYGPYYSEEEGMEALEYFDADGDGTDDWVVPFYEDASQGAEFDPDLMVFKYKSFFPELEEEYLQKFPFSAPENGAISFFETGRTLTSGVDIQGGTELSTYRLAYTNVDATGVMPNSEMNKHSLSVNGSFDLTKKLRISSQAIYTNTYTKGRNHTGYSDNIMSSFRQWYDVGVDMLEQKEFYERTGKNVTWNPFSYDDLSPHYWDNPYWQRYENYQDDTRDRIVGYARVDYDITDDLSFNAQYSLDGYTFVQEERKAVGSVSGELGIEIPDVTSGYVRNTIEQRETNFDALLKYHKVFDDLDLNAFVGTNMRRVFYERVRASTNGGLAVPGTYALSNSAVNMLPPEEVYQKTGVDGIFGSVSLGFKNLVYIDGTIRRDVSSTLPADNWAYIYPGVSGSFVFSELLDVSWLNNGKLRVNWAQVGNDAPWGAINDIYRVVNPFHETMVRLDYVKRNPELVPEISTTLEGGLALNMFSYRVGLDLALYKINTVDQITRLPVSFATGYTSKYVNIGEVQNQGVEISLNLVPVRLTDFEWNIDLNWAKNVNEVIKLGEGITNYQINSLQGGITINAREGEPLGSIQGTDFRYSPDGRKIVSGGYYDNTPTSDELIGNIQPDWTGGIMNTFSYKGFSASFLIDMQKGGDIFSLDLWYGMGTGLYEETADNNDLGNPKRDPRLPIYDNDDNITGYEAASGGILNEGVVEILDDDGNVVGYEENIIRINGANYGAYGWATNPNARYIYDASYVKLREASISYSLPKSILGSSLVKGASISLVGSNLWIIHKNLPHADPEASQGAGNTQGWQSGVLPATRNYGFKVNLTF